MLTRSTFLMGLIVCAECVAADESWGVWQDADGSNVYEFLPKNEFRFSGVKKAWIQYQGLRSNPLHHIPIAGQPRGQYVQERYSLNGAWETGASICKADAPEAGL